MAAYAQHVDGDPSQAAAMALPSYGPPPSHAPPHPGSSPPPWSTYFNLPDDGHSPHLNHPGPPLPPQHPVATTSAVPWTSAHDAWAPFPVAAAAPEPFLPPTLKRKPATIGTLATAWTGLVAPAPLPPNPSSSGQPSTMNRAGPAITAEALEQHRMGMAAAQQQPVKQGVPGFTLSPLTAKPVTFFSYNAPSDAAPYAPPARTALASSWNAGRSAPTTASEPYPPSAQVVASIPDRPFRCDVCAQSFNRGHDLKRHKRIHLVVKPYPCGWCERTFSRKDALKRHLLVKGCGVGQGQTQEDSEAGVSKAPMLLQRAHAEAVPELRTSMARSPSSNEDPGSPGSGMGSPLSQASSPSSPPVVARQWAPHGRRRSAPTYLAMPPPRSPATIFNAASAKVEQRSPTQALAHPPAFDQPPEPAERPRMRSLDSYAESSMSGESSTFASPAWRRQDSLESGPSSMEDSKSPGIYDLYAPSLTILTCSYTPSYLDQPSPPPETYSPRD